MAVFTNVLPCRTEKYVNPPGDRFYPHPNDIINITGNEWYAFTIIHGRKGEAKMIYRMIFAVVILGFLSACGSTSEKRESATVEYQSASTQNSTRAFGTDSNSAGSISPLNDPTSSLAGRIIYFEYDSSAVLPGYREAVEAHAQYLAQNQNVTVTLEGHADERGSREYNLALGERRSQSIKRQMMLFGPSSSQIRTTSYGEERPVIDGHNEQSYSQNRRVEIIY